MLCLLFWSVDSEISIFSFKLVHTEVEQKMNFLLLAGINR